jgi:hypothetical protein
VELPPLLLLLIVPLPLVLLPVLLLLLLLLLLALVPASLLLLPLLWLLLASCWPGWLALTSATLTDVTGKTLVPANDNMIADLSRQHVGMAMNWRAHDALNRFCCMLACTTSNMHAASVQVYLTFVANCASPCMLRRLQLPLSDREIHLCSPENPDSRTACADRLNINLCLNVLCMLPEKVCCWLVVLRTHSCQSPTTEMDPKTVYK